MSTKQLTTAKAMFGLPEGEYLCSRTRLPIVIRYTSGQDRIQCCHVGEDSKQCKRWAIPYRDYCEAHASNNKSLKTGIHSKYAVGRLGPLMEVAEKDPEMKSLRSEVSLLRAFLADMLNTIAEDKVQGKIGEVIALTDQIRKTVRDLASIEDSMRLTLDASQVKLILTQILMVITEEVTDQSTKVRIAKRIEGISICET
jgi:hypothetical protein